MAQAPAQQGLQPDLDRKAQQRPRADPPALPARRILEMQLEIALETLELPPFDLMAGNIAGGTSMNDLDGRHIQNFLARLRDVGYWSRLLNLGRA